MVLVKNSQDFTNTILKSKNNFALVKFYADWCYPCKLMAPIFDELSKTKLKESVDFIKINRDENLQIILDFGFKIPTIPRFFLVKVIDRLNSRLEINDLGGSQNIIQLENKVKQFI